MSESPPETPEAKKPAVDELPEEELQLPAAPTIEPKQPRPPPTRPPMPPTSPRGDTTLSR